MSATWRFCRLRHLPSEPSQSFTATSVRPASLRLATTFDPMNPAPPVTKIINASQGRLGARPSFAPLGPGVQSLVKNRGKPASAKRPATAGARKTEQMFVLSIK